MVHAVPGLWSADFLERSMSDCRPPRAGLCASLEHPEHCSRSEFSLLRSPPSWGHLLNWPTSSVNALY